MKTTRFDLFTKDHSLSQQHALIGIMEDITQNVAALLPAVATNLVIEERSIPSPGPDEVLIHNHFIGLNPIDWKRQAWGFMINSYPTILGAGT